MDRPTGNQTGIRRVKKCFVLICWFCKQSSYVCKFHCRLRLLVNRQYNLIACLHYHVYILNRITFDLLTRERIVNKWTNVFWCLLFAFANCIFESLCFFPSGTDGQSHKVFYSIFVTNLMSVLLTAVIIFLSELNKCHTAPYNLSYAYLSYAQNTPVSNVNHLLIQSPGRHKVTPKIDT